MHVSSDDWRLYNDGWHELPLSHVPDVETGLAWVFLHTVLAVEVQGLTISSSSAQLVWRQKDSFKA